MTTNVQNPIFTDETKARERLEARVWPNGPVCPHCGSAGDDVTKLTGKKHRPGVYQCNACREQFTVTRVLQNPVVEMAGRAVLAHGFQKGSVGASSASLARHFLQECVVHDAPLT